MNLLLDPKKKYIFDHVSYLTTKVDASEGYVELCICWQTFRDLGFIFN